MQYTICQGPLCELFDAPSLLWQGIYKSASTAFAPYWCGESLSAEGKKLGYSRVCAGHSLAHMYGLLDLFKAAVAFQHLLGVSQAGVFPFESSQLPLGPKCALCSSNLNGEPLLMTVYKCPQLVLSTEPWKDQRKLNSSSLRHRHRQGLSGKDSSIAHKVIASTENQKKTSACKGNSREKGHATEWDETFASHSSGRG